MAKLYFKYGVMGSSKSAQALMCKFNYEQVGFSVTLLKPSLDDRDKKNGTIVVKSRIGLSSECSIFDKDTNLFDMIKKKNNFNDKSVVIVDECQFCTKDQINELKSVSTHIPVLCYGLLINFKTELFEGSKRLVEIADSLMEIKAVCECGRKASVNARFADGKLVLDGEEIVIGGNESYKALCYNCYNKLKEEIEKEKTSMNKKMLLHACCGPCASGVIPQLLDYDITVIYYNPNIDTLEEYNKRLEALKIVVNEMNKEYKKDIKVISIPYNHDEFASKIKGLENEPEGGKRCDICFALRLDYVANYAKNNGFDIWASTLSVSPHKDHNKINTIGNSIAKKYNCEYYPSNFKKKNGFLMSIQNSKKYGIYRQTYCGCTK